MNDIVNINEMVVKSSDGITKPSRDSIRMSEELLNKLRPEKYDVKLKKYIDAIGVLVVELDTNGTVLLLNKKGCEILGFEEQEIIGKNWFDTVIPDDDCVEVKNIFERVIKGDIKGVDYHRNNVLTKDKKQKVIGFHNIIIRDEFLRVVKIIASGEDVTDHILLDNELRLSTDFLNNMMDAVLNPIFVKDENHKFILVNTSFCKFVNKEREGLIGNDDSLFFPEDQVKIFWEKDDEVINYDKEVSNEEKLTVVDGTTKIILTKKKRYVDQDGRKFLVGMITDLTEIKLMQEDIIKRNEELEKFNQFSINRELKMIELKKEINDLLIKSKQESKYKTVD